MKKATLLELLKSGVHFGHQSSRWHPKMKPYIFTKRNGIHIIDLEKTATQLEIVGEHVKKMAAEGKVILFVGTKRQAKELTKKYAVGCGMPYIAERWLGGLFTNFQTVSQLMKNLKNLKKQKASGDLEKYTKKEQLQFDEEIARLEKFVGGMENMVGLPDAIFVVGVREEKTAVKEAQKKGIPIIGIADTNVNPNDLTYMIPGNDDATKSLDVLMSTVATYIKEGMDLTKAHTVVGETKKVAVLSVTK